LPLSFSIANQLVDPVGSSGDVVFHLHADKHITHRLHATREILEKKSQYFMASMSDRLLYRKANNFKGFQPEWNQGAAPLPVDSSSAEEIPENSDHGIRRSKRIRRDQDADDAPIEIHLDQEKDDIDFVTLHNILYYLYTGCVNLPFTVCPGDAERYVDPPGFPDPADPFLVYKNAKKFLMDDLAHHAFEVLRETLTPANVIERLFGGPDDLRLCDELVNMYIDYLVANHEAVKQCGDWEAMDWDAECGEEVGKFRWSVVRQIMVQLRAGPS
jgi:hypothetical protein